MTDARQPTAMPPAVRHACTLVLLSLALGVITLLPGLRPPEAAAEQVPPGTTLAIVLVFGGITLWLVQLVRRGRNRGRWLLLGYLALGWWLSLDQLTADFTASPLIGLLDVAGVLMEMAAVLLLFADRSSRWFR